MFDIDNTVIEEVSPLNHAPYMTIAVLDHKLELSNTITGSPKERHLNAVNEAEKAAVME